jgi:hypothetical protein
VLKSPLAGFSEIVLREAYLVFREEQDRFSRDANDERRFTDSVWLGEMVLGSFAETKEPRRSGRNPAIIPCLIFSIMV